MKTKTIILSCPEKNSNLSGRGILSFHMEDELLICKLRLYNIAPLDRHAKLAIYHQEEVYSANLLERNGCFETSLVGNFDIDKDFYIAVIDGSHNNNIIISGGTYSGFFFEDFNQELSSKTNTEPEASTMEENHILCQECTNCKYKQFFYEYNPQPANQSITNNEEEKNIEYLSKTEIEQPIPNTILESLIPQFDYIFDKYPQNQELTNLIAESKFVEIKENNQSFSIGALYNKEELKYICYAVKSKYNQPAPNELGEHYQWLPLDAEDPLSDGYYIVFQDATDLKIVEL